ncbi:MAG: hypothetical protein Q8O67_20525 [Deltaproteobacteria bacterium]|nr:hypothetical protein [Deltaproteobacteria bacterium]
MTTRRRLLAVGATSTALLGVGGLLSWLTRGYDTGPDRAVALSNKELAIVKSVVEALFPAQGAFPSGVDVGVVSCIDEEIFSQPTSLQEDLKAAIQVLEHAPPVVGVLHRLSALPVVERARTLQLLMQRGPAVVVQCAVSLKQLASLAYYAQPRVWGAIGYDGPWVPVASPPASHARYLAALAQRGS